MQSSERPSRLAINGATEAMLPSYEEAMDVKDCKRLPGYRETFSKRYHPYKRPVVVKTVDERDRLLNTVFDDEYVPLDIPAVRNRRPLTPLQMIDDAEGMNRLGEDLERAIQFELRVQRLDNAILDFIEGVRRAHTPE